MIRRYDETFPGLLHRHGCRAGQQFSENTRVFRIEMLSQDQSYTGVGRHILQNFRECFEPPGGCAKAGHWAEVRYWAGLVWKLWRLRRRCASGRLWFVRLRSIFRPYCHFPKGSTTLPERLVQCGIGVPASLTTLELFREGRIR